MWSERREPTKWGEQVNERYPRPFLITLIRSLVVYSRLSLHSPRRARYARDGRHDKRTAWVRSVDGSWRSVRDMETEVGPVTLPFTSLFMNGPSVFMSLPARPSALWARRYLFTSSTPYPSRRRPGEGRERGNEPREWRLSYRPPTRPAGPSPVRHSPSEPAPLVTSLLVPPAARWVWGESDSGRAPIPETEDPPNLPSSRESSVPYGHFPPHFFSVG